MAYALSPGVTVTERDFTTVVPAVSSTMGAFAGGFEWGPVLYPIQLSTENELVAQFGKPQSSNFEDFFTAANFLSYSSGMWINRKDSAAGKNAVSITTSATDTVIGSASTAIKVKNIDDYTSQTQSGTFFWTAKYPGKMGNSLTVSMADAYTYKNRLLTGTISITAGSNAVTGSAGFLQDLHVGGILKVPATSASTTVTTGVTGASTIIVASATGIVVGQTVYGAGIGLNATVTAINGTTITLSTANTAIVTGTITFLGSFTTVGTIASIGSATTATLTAAYGSALTTSAAVIDWAYASQFDGAPGTSTYSANNNGGNDQMHIIVLDTDGSFSGTAGTILEKFAYVSKASDAKGDDGLNNYYKDVINNKSKYIWWNAHDSAISASGTAWGTLASGSVYKSMLGATVHKLAGGVDDFTDTSGTYAQAAWALYLDDSTYDINLLPVGKATVATINYVVQNICEVRKDCMAFISPMNATTVTDISTYTIATGSGSTATTPLVTFRNSLTASSYAFLDSGFKYQYDRYNDAYRWVPLCGDTAGLTARADYTNDPWWSPAGYNRGVIKNVIKLAVNPSKTDRDTLYQSGINPVVSFPGNGIVLFGDKTMTGKPSAFDRINVRRLFITLEKAISTASKYSLFEFNDSFTQAQFKNMVEPYLRDVQGKRGITDFRVKCDSTNNTGEVIDRNEFVADIYIKPARSINYITLSFIATRSGVDFTTVGA